MVTYSTSGQNTDKATLKSDIAAALTTQGAPTWLIAACDSAIDGNTNPAGKPATFCTVTAEYDTVKGKTSINTLRVEARA